MREGIFILIVAAMLLGVTLFKYRRGILTAYRFTRAVRGHSKEKRKIKETEAIKESQMQELVSCSRCGVWVSRGNAVGFGNDRFYCSSKCMTHNK